ncbi:riboflavin biosynthesis protein ribF [Candidatus Photodesmus katoptron]|uniref:Riboflavin biosynthesis protein n=1 Tax=Candidatus Photodesmus katoptron Akat1 TaxID=1236703 RepID=S3EGM7_9GAMM|nr:bifunctional riboflavin kinase/FAD synthetase [Candidatus Photodesmus katoptron]EPE37303.1 riboflavin biosynthesis protein RibF [Candidatus Photodesmus katoptron Akat1]KEY90026.1 riboflavin biosynthesis protein ribF [Candidatus Photodesmus katoptron]
MELIRGIKNIKVQHKSCVLTIGNFDGVHLGHRYVLNQLVKHAKILNLPSIVMIFEPQPLEFFSENQSPARLTRFRDKFIQLSKFGLDYVLCIHFNKYFANLSAESFILDFLVSRLDVKLLILGDDFCFGRDRMGNFSMLKKAGENHAFQVISTKSFHFKYSRISSTSIRSALAHGKLSQASQMLGRKYSISGRVSHGQKLGRTIGFPTANIPLKRFVVPISGVYVVHVLGLRKQSVNGVANIGNRPTINALSRQLEVHIFDFYDDFYGNYLEVFFLHKIRNEQKFSSFKLLKKQIELDAKLARSWFFSHLTS